MFFTNLDDAKEMLREMVQSDSYAKDARILVVSMEKAYGMVRAGPRSTGYVKSKRWSLVFFSLAFNFKLKIK